MPTCGSLFSGVGLLDAGLHLAGWEHAWLCESDEWRRGILAQRFPGAVVYDDVRTLRGPFAADAAQTGRREAVGTGQQRGVGCDVGADSHAVAVTLIAGGFPCKGASTAGKREGFGHAETVLWHEMRRIIGEVRPRYVLIENVANILGMAAAPGEPAGSLWGTVLGDLAALGFGDIRWDCVPAGAVGAPHLRDRVFCVARLADAGDDARRSDEARRDHARANGTACGRPEGADQHGAGGQDAASRGVTVEWGDYAPAIQRWEAIHGQAPAPLVSRVRGVDARSAGRVDRSRLSALGDGVCVYVGRLVGEYVMSLEHERLAGLEQAA